MATKAEAPGSWTDAVPKTVDAVTNLYNAVAAKSPLVADTVVILAMLLPFYIVYAWSIGLRSREKEADEKVKASRKASKKVGKSKTGGKKP
ncbi:hypothetical protein [Pseudomonas oryziphila]|uniref:Uncharacterized protein n=1 Tax=Pseudomonas oryziphila TaxID=2894079 RepID=A0ABM7CSX6_9PSED|nr:hypothetical protein [Pseudomonas oryziphila]AZL74549.1 hypothetical protein EI693_16315 [Pseudomonas oryziphila]